LSLRRKAFSSRSESRVSRKGKHPVNGDGERDCSSNVIANLTRQSIFFRRMMDARIKSGHDDSILSDQVFKRVAENGKNLAH
jgi:hypothetical protein